METKTKKVKGVRSKVDLSCQHITTSFLSAANPIFCRKVVPGDKFNVKLSQLNRVDALPVPSFVKIKNNVDAFYVKYSQIWKPWDAYITQAPYAAPAYSAGGTTVEPLNTIPQEVPYISIADLYTWFASFHGTSNYGNDLSTVTVVNKTGTNDPTIIDVYNDINTDHLYDFAAYQSNAAIGQPLVYQRKLTFKGRCFYKILYALGYRLPSVMDYQDWPMYKDIHMSLLPLMAFCSVKLNWYVPLKFRDYSFINSISYLVDPVPTHFSGGVANLGSQAYEDFIESLIRLSTNVYYGSDYFHDSLISVFGNNFTPLHSLHDPVSDTYTRGVVSPGTPSGVSFQEPMIRADVNNGGYSATNNWNLTEYLLYGLKAITSEAQISALTKNDLVAAATSLFGYKPECADMVPYHLKHKRGSIYITPETMLADTADYLGEEGAPGGYKAGSGQGVLSMKGSFDFETYGQLIFVNSIMPDEMYVHGINRELLATTKDLEYDENMARLGYQAIGQCELSLIHLYANTPNVGLRSTFGFTEKYAELAYKKDSMGGAFCIPTENNGLDVFHFARRDYNREYAADGQWHNNETFAKIWAPHTGSLGRVDGYQYNRIFEVQNGTVEPIQQWNIFDIVADRSILAKNEFVIGDDYDGQEIKNPSVGNVLND